MDISQRIEQFINADYPPNETDVSFAFDLLEDCKKEIENLQAQNERYRVALEDIYIEDKDSKAAKIAQQALTGETK